MAAIEQLTDAVRIGVLSASVLGREEMRDALARTGFEVPVEDSLAGYLYNLQRHEPVDVLLVDLEEAGERDLDALEELVERISAPMVFSEANARPEHKGWMRRLARKLARAAELAAEAPPVPVQPVVEQRPAAPAPNRAAKPTGVVREERVWVLGASFGGPEAVKRFLGAMPEVPEAAFIIAQHIGNGFVEVMAQQLSRFTRFEVLPAGEGTMIRPGGVYIAPVDKVLRIDEQGVVTLEDETRRLTYAPSIDAVMEEVAARYGANSGAIIFSGMGDDGSQGCRAIAAAGGEVWAQDSATCAIDSMPACARNTGLVRHSAGPEDLAADLAKHLKAATAAS